METFTANLESLHAMLQWINDRLAGIFDPSILKKIELASEEAIVNVIEHAYQGAAGTIAIDVKILKNHAEIIFIDQGPPFDPLRESKEISQPEALEDWEIGGLGIHFIKNVMDEVRYQRVDDKNILTLVKKIT